jgi:hypothetical protein
MFPLTCPLAGFQAYITGNRFIPGVYFPHPGLQEGSLASLVGRVEHPIQLVADIPVKLRPHEPFRRGKHIVILRVAEACGVEKTNFPLYGIVIWH